MGKLLVLLSFFAELQAMGTVKYTNRRVLIKDEVVSGNTDFKIDVSISDAEREHLMKEVFRHRILGYLRTTTVPENGEVVEKVNLRLLELKDISRALANKKPIIAYNSAQPKAVTPVNGTPSELPKQPIGKLNAVLDDLEKLKNYHFSGDYLSAALLLTKVKNTHIYIKGALPPTELVAYEDSYNRTLSVVSVDGILVDTAIDGINLTESESSPTGRKAREVINYAIGIQKCSGEPLIYKLLIAYVFAKQSMDSIYLKTRSNIQNCDPQLLTRLLNDQISKIGVINALKGNALSDESRAQILEAVSRELTNPAENIKNGFVGQMSQIISAN